MLKYVGVLFNFPSWNYFAEMNAMFLLVVVGSARHLDGL